MSQLEEIKIDLAGIGDILRNSNLSVPRYQRSYAWKENHVSILFQDLENAIHEGANEYFLGSIVISQKDEKRPEVVDGQQRLATATILLAAIRDYFYCQGNSQDRTRAQEIEKDYLFDTDLETLELLPRLQLNEADQVFFLRRVLALPDSPDRKEMATKESHRRIEIAAEIAKTYVEKAVASTKDPTRLLIDLVQYVHGNAKVIWVRVPDDADAFTIFETLNDRGLRLAISDLLKNYLFHLSANRINEVQQWWVSMIGTLEAVDSEEMLVTYIRQYWSSRYGLTRERELYQKIKERIRTKQKAVDLANELNENSRLYAAILNSTHETWTDFGSTAREHMATLNELGMIQLRPLLLAILAKFPVSEAKKSLRLLVSTSVRFLIFGGLGGGALESEYCQRAVEVRDGTITTAKDLAAAMKDVVPSDGEFQKAFEVASVSKDFLARYYLRVLEKQIRGESEPELVPNSNEEVVTLEHILPENPSSAWGKIEPEEAKAYYKRIGNMALLKKRINSVIGNAGFPAKAPFYKGSEFKLTHSLAHHGDWGIEKIEERQKDLAKLAVQAWPYKIH